MVNEVCPVARCAAFTLIRFVSPGTSVLVYREPQNADEVFICFGTRPEAIKLAPLIKQ